MNGEDAVVRNSLIDAEGADNGIFIGAQGVTVEQTEITGAVNFGIETFSGLDPSGSDILESQIHNNGNGILVEGSLTITDNIVENNGDDGIWLSEDAAGTDVLQNDIQQNARAGLRGQTEDEFDPIDASGITVNNNNIVNNDEAGFFVDDVNDEPLDATNNWWGSTDGPDSEDANDASGDIDFEPFLDEAFAPTEISVTAQNPSPATSGETATYEAAFTYDQPGSEVTEFVSVDFGTESVDVSSVDANDVTITAPDDSTIEDAAVTTDSDSIVVELADDAAIDDPDSGEYSVEVGDVDNGDADTHTLTLELHEQSDSDVNSPAAAFATGSDSYTVDTAPEPAEFTVDIDSTNSPVEVGEGLSVTATVTNVGDETGSDTVVLSLDDTEVDSMSVDELAGDASAAVTLIHETTDDDVGDPTATVETTDDSASQTVSVTEPVEDELEFAELWTTDFAGSIYATPAVGEHVYVGNGERISAVDAGSGANVWTVRADDAVATTPAVHDGTVIVGSDDGTVYALDAGTGDEQWAYDTGSAILTSSPVVDDGTVYIGDADGALHAIDLDGEAVWTANIGAAITATPAAVGDSVYVADTDGTVEAFGTADGATEWTGTVSAGVYGEIAADADADAVYVGTLDGSVVALAADDGTEDWTVDVPSAELLGPQLTLNDGTVFAGTDDAALVALASDTGDQLWQTDVPGQVAPAPTVDGDRLYAGDSSGGLAGYGASDAALFDLEIESTNSPVTAGETLEVTTAVENLGSEAGEETIELDLGNGAVDSETVSLDGGASDKITLTYETADADVGTQTATVSGEETTATVSVEIGAADEPAPAEFDVTIESTNSPVQVGDSLDVETTIENVGEQSGEETITLDLGGEVVADESVSLDAAASETITLSYETADADVGTQTATVSGDLRSDSVSIEVEDDSEESSPSPAPAPAPSPDPAAFDLSTVETNAPVNVGETLTATVTIENTGDEDDQQDITLVIDDEVVDSESLTLAGGDTADVTLSTTFDEVGEYDAVIGTDDDSTTVIVSVTEADDGTDDESDERGDEAEQDEGSDDETEQDEESDEADEEDTEQDGESDDTEQVDETDDVVEDAPADDDQPGFGIVVAVLALLTAGMFTRRSN